ncbi:unnamed protein product [Rotaria magnacalcarata]|uniref:MACPF domain-containing protein n=2 Tax=Rotaria magnacalcarata TaxID=392030 RepID=A0A815HF21_9BILA|nr:unnamed protein product [Rotaria magnacalcarata]
MKFLLNFIVVLLVWIRLGHTLSELTRTELCPVIGFYGLFCPSSSMETPSREDTIRSSTSRGIGMTIDLSTGEIKLPALSTTYNEKYMLSKKSIPTVAASDAERLEPIVYLFRTEQDFVYLWEQDSGSWLGGELSHIKNMLHVHKTFFIENEAVAIVQHLYPLYTLEIKSTNTNLELNQYAQQAIGQLPFIYDTRTYKDFLDIWGTHVILETLIGGMHEQQALVKDCIFRSTYFTRGLTESELELRLKADLLSRTSMNDSYYDSRRRIILDHRIGGESNVSNIDQWKQSLNSKPALLKINKYTPWSDIVHNSIIKANLQTAITSRIKLAANTRIDELNQVQRYKLDALFVQRPAQAVIGHGSRGPVPPSWEIIKDFILLDEKRCPEGLSLAESKEKCNSGAYITSWNTVKLTEPLRYERNLHTGMFRSIRVRDFVAEKYIERAGAWVKSGCSLQPTIWSNMNEPPPPSTIVAMICADCIPRATGTNQELFECECPSY